MNRSNSCRSVRPITEPPSKTNSICPTNDLAACAMSVTQLARISWFALIPHWIVPRRHSSYPELGTKESPEERASVRLPCGATSRIMALTGKASFNRLRLPESGVAPMSAATPAPKVAETNMSSDNGTIPPLENGDRLTR